MRPVIVFGSNGMLGHYLHTFLKKMGHSVVGITRQDFDVEKDDETKLRYLFNHYRPRIIINAIGKIPHAGHCMDELYYMVNSNFPNKLAKLCHEHTCIFIQPSTDCVFSGKLGNYNELSIFDTHTVYGKSKLLGEIESACIIRTSIIGENSKGISLLEWVKSNKHKKIHGYANHYWNGITCLQFAKIVQHMIDNNLFWQGVRHVFSPQSVAKADLVEMISDEYNLNVCVEKVHVDLCNRTLSTIYQDHRSLLDTIPDLSTQLQQLHKYSNEVKM